MKAPISRLTINGNSMSPTLKPGQDVLSVNWFVNPKIGDVVVVKSDKGKVQRDIVKRVVRIEGDKVFVEGDNKGKSTDSRDFGPISKDQVVGKIVYKSEANSNVSNLENSNFDTVSKFDIRNSNLLTDCPKCSSPVIGIYGRKDAICRTCGYKLICCGE